MPADSRHQDYEAREAQWARCRAAIAGQDAVHAAGVTVLPKLSEQTDAEYAAYKKRTPWYGATGRTLDGMVGMVFRKPPITKMPEAMSALAEDITLGGMKLDGLTRELLQDVVGVGRIGILVEFPVVAEAPASLADASARNLRPYATIYRAESIINWRLARVNNIMQAVQVVLMETYEKPTADRFKVETGKQVRELALEGGKYLQRVFRQNEKQEWVQEGADIVPLMRGNPLGSIPFHAFGPEALTLEVQQSPILDLVDTNLSHFRTAADLEHGAHFTGLPTPFIAGVNLKEGEKIKIGSTEAITSSAPEAKASYLEFTGRGLEALEKLLDRKEKQMAALGARMLAPEKAGIEAAETLALRQSGEMSVLANIASLTAQGVQAVLRFMADWAGISGEVTYTLNTDYLPVGMTAQSLTALVTAWQQGALTDQELFFNLQGGELIPPETDFDAHQDQLATKPPSLGPGAAEA